MTTVAERVLPHNLEAERSILGAILLHNDALTTAELGCGALDFYRAAHQKLFQAMQRLAAAGVGIDLTTLKEELSKVGELDEVGGPAYITSMVDGVPHSTNVEHYAAIVKEKSRLRGLIFAANNVLADAYDGEDGSSAIIERGTRELLGLAGTGSAEPIQVGKAVLEYAEGLYAEGPPPGVMTGYADLDETTGGFQPADLAIVAARPSMGKTSLALCIAKGAAALDFPTLVLSLEMRRRQLAGKVLAYQSRIGHTRLERRFIGERDHGKIGQACGDLLEQKFWIQESPPSLTEVSAWCRRWRDQYGIRLAIIDYLQLLLPPEKTQSRERDVAAVSWGLKQLAKQLDICVIALSQLRRGSEQRRDPRPQLSDLRESGALEQDADLALLLHRQEVYTHSADDRGIAEVIVAKNRSGATGTVRLAFIADLGGLFENLAPEAGA